MADRDSARAAKERLRTQLAQLGGVGGIGIGRRGGGYVVTVDVAEESQSHQVPSSCDGVDVEVRVIGVVRPLGTGAGAAPGLAAGTPAAAGRRRPARGATTGPAAARAGVRWGLGAQDGAATGR